MAEKLSTDAYKGTRDFYPKDMAVQRYIFDTWAKTAELFGFERYDASILEPSELYKSKGAENEELVNEQTYTFTDRGDREVTLRPEMTPTVARMVAARRRDLSFPVRWYSIPNLFRYERPQRGRLREHWQLNCDMFGVDDVSADVEMIALAYNVLKAFSAKDEDFEIRINDRASLHDKIKAYKEKMNEDTSSTSIAETIRSLDRKGLEGVVKEKVDAVLSFISNFRNANGVEATDKLSKIKASLEVLGIKVTINHSLARGFDYYTGTIFEIFDTDPKNNRSLIGGGRYDNLTSLFGGDAISGIGFGMGDVTMRDFLETHNLFPRDIHVTAPTLIIVPMEVALNIESEKIAQEFRTQGISTSVDLSDKKIGKKLASASDAGAKYVLVVGDDEIKNSTYTLKELATKNETSGTLPELLKHLS